MQKKTARKVIGTTASVCAAIAAVPIPLADILPITSAQVAMIMSIGYISGRSMSKKTVSEFLTAAGINVGAAFVIREVARGLVKWILPGVGNAISASVAFAATWGIGETAVAYFIDDQSMKEAKKRGNKARKKHEKDDPEEDASSVTT